MRGCGEVTSARGLVPFGHLGWCYRDRAEFTAHAAEYLQDGLEQGQYVEYVAAGPRAALEAEAAALPGAARALVSGQFAARSIEDFYVYATPRVVDPATSVRRRAQAVQRALDAGWTGFRAIVDVTPLVRDAAGRDAFARFEIRVDEVMAAQPVSALCGYDETALDGWAPMFACLHPYTGPGSAPFRFFTDDDGGLAFDGELGPDQEALVGQVLDRLGRQTGPVTIDLSRVDHVAHAVLDRLDDYARRHDTTVLLRDVSMVAPRTYRASTVDELNAQVDNLTAALRSRDVIGQAKGILMVTRRLSEDDAFAELRRASQALNRKVRDLAEDVVRTGVLP